MGKKSQILQSAQAAPRISEAEKRAACLIVARFRKALDTTLSLPEWQDAIQSCMVELKLPSQRQGISLVQAIHALPLESKRDIADELFSNVAIRLKGRSAESLRRAWGIVSRTQTIPEFSSSQWKDLKRSLTIRLASRYRAYKSAQSFLYHNYEYIVNQSVKEICRQPSRRQDCEQEGSLGLLQATDRIEPDRPFASYAFQWTRRRVRNFLMRNSIPISAPINLISKASRSRNHNDSDVDTKSLAVALNCLQGAHLEFTDEAMEQALPHAKEGALCPIAEAIKADLSELLEAALAQLTAKQREMLALRFGVLDRDIIDSLQGIAKATDISRQQVSRRESRALSKLESLFSPLMNEMA